MSTDDSQTLTSRGAALRDDDRHEEALPILREAVAAHEPDADRLLALTLKETGDLDGAKRVLIAALDHGQTHLACLLGDIADDLQDAELAESAYRKTIDAGDETASNDYGVFLIGQERFDEAIDVFNRAIEKGDSLAAGNLVGLYLDDLGDLDTAERLALRYLDRKHPSTYAAIADVYAEQGRLDEADTMFRTAIELYAPKAHQKYANFLWEKRDDLVAAEREFRLAQDNDERGWGYELGSFLVEQDRHDEAREVLAWAASWGDVNADELLGEIDSEADLKPDR